MSSGRARGQTSASYLGVVILVAATVGAVLSVGVPSAVGDGMGQAVCRITSFVDGGGNCDGGSTSTDGSDEPSSSDPSEPEPTPREQAEAGDYVAIGDSFSSGEGAYDYDPGTDTDDNMCHRSDNAYPQRTADEFDFEGEVVVATCSGARNRHVLDDEQYDEGLQIDAITDDTSLVTIGIGGNDANWTDVIIDCLSDLGSNCEDNEGAVRADIEAAADGVLEVYLEAAARAPDDARIVAVGYPRFFPEPPEGNLFQIDLLCTPLVDKCAKRLGLSSDEQAWMNEQFRYFNDLLAQKAEEAGIEFVDMHDAFDGHEFGTDDPYMNDLVLDWPDWDECGLSTDEIKACLGTVVQSETSHPNAAGQERMAELVAEQIENGP